MSKTSSQSVVHHDNGAEGLGKNHIDEFRYILDNPPPWEKKARNQGIVGQERSSGIQ
jgi:hypothetical protein